MEHRPTVMLLTLAMAFSLAGCAPDATPPEGTPDADDALEAPPALPAVLDAVELPAEFVVSTNEPFWQARVENGELVLSGPEVEGRRFAIVHDETGDGARQVHGSDDAGTIAVTIRPGPCQDSMSGAEFPQSGELTIDGIGPTMGCARPADMPPPGEPGL